jgi:hypothetical protein
MGASEDLERKARFFARGFHGQKMRPDAFILAISSFRLGIFFEIHYNLDNLGVI